MVSRLGPTPRMNPNVVAPPVARSGALSGTLSGAPPENRSETTSKTKHEALTETLSETWPESETDPFVGFMSISAFCVGVVSERVALSRPDLQTNSGLVIDAFQRCAIVSIVSDFVAYVMDLLLDLQSVPIIELGPKWIATLGLFACPRYQTQFSRAESVVVAKSGYCIGVWGYYRVQFHARGRFPDW